MRHLKGWVTESWQEIPLSLEGTQYNGLYGEAPLKERAVFILEANENVRIC